MKKIAFITSHFPFDGGEQFIESEIPFWINSSEISVVLFPVNCKGNKRNTPDGVLVDNSLSERLSLYNYIFLLFCAAFSTIFIKEIIWLFKEGKLCYSTLKRALANVYAVYKAKYKLKKKFKQYQINTAYCYWNDVQAYASSMLKREGVIQKVFTRCHGYDLYEDRHDLGYIPLKRQFKNDFDVWFVISKSAKAYLENQFGVKPNNIQLSRLGVDIPEMYASCSPAGVINIVTVSYCIFIKRLDKIIDALQCFSSKHSDIKVEWNHIGGGELEAPLKNNALEKLQGANIKVSFLGTLSNSSVKDYFSTNDVDIFINTSDSEGVPVSIMEAMSYGVPIIAPDIGGISELIDVEGCILLPEKPSPQVISNAIYQAFSACKKQVIRESCKNKIYNKFNAAKNFTNFINIIKKHS